MAFFDSPGLDSNPNSRRFGGGQMNHVTPLSIHMAIQRNRVDAHPTKLPGFGRNPKQRKTETSAQQHKRMISFLRQCGEATCDELRANLDVPSPTKCISELRALGWDIRGYRVLVGRTKQRAMIAYSLHGSVAAPK
jgi:Helix-turn-helix domain